MLCVFTREGAGEQEEGPSRGEGGGGRGGAKRKGEEISSSFAAVAAYSNVSKSNVSSVGLVFFQPQ